jgi:hypothetical protein
LFFPYLLAYDDMGFCRLGGSLAVPCRLSTPSDMVEGWTVNDGRVTNGRKMNGEQCDAVSHTICGWFRRIREARLPQPLTAGVLDGECKK